MGKVDRRDQLKELHQARKAQTNHKVDEAIKRLLKARKSVNFNSVSSESGVSKATLYNNPEIRERIDSLRRQQALGQVRDATGSHCPCDCVRDRAAGRC